MKRILLLAFLFSLSCLCIAQYVGIGTATPNAKLQIRGLTNSNLSASLHVTNNSGTSILYVRDDQKVGLGTTEPGKYFGSARLELADNDGNNSDFVMRVGNSMGAPIISWSEIVFQRSDGNLATPTLIASPITPIGRLNAMGYDGTNYEPAARIVLGVGGATGNNDMPGTIYFETTPDGSALPLERMRIMPNGFVGIGTNTPAAPLHVSGFVNSVVGAYAFYALAACSNVGCADGLTDVSILASNRVRASEFNAFSDARIKNVVGISDPFGDLSLLQKIQVTNYTHKDIAEKGNAIKKGFIAQQVEQVFPQAVSKSLDFIPNIYRSAENLRFDPIFKTFSFTLPDVKDLFVGEKLRIIADKPYEKDIIYITGDTVTVRNWEKSDTKEAFVYGKQIQDFRNVDYDRIFTLHVSATQALIQKMERLETEVAALKGEIAKLKNGE